MLTREKALEKHREMWTAMQEKLGDRPHRLERAGFKIDWCEQHEEDDIYLHCYLCQYVKEHGLGCENCPIDWGNSEPSCIGEHADYAHSPISEILALPERKVNENGVVAETKH